MVEFDPLANVPLYSVRITLKRCSTKDADTMRLLAGRSELFACIAPPCGLLYRFFQIDIIAQIYFRYVQRIKKFDVDRFLFSARMW